MRAIVSKRSGILFGMLSLLVSGLWSSASHAVLFTHTFSPPTVCFDDEGVTQSVTLTTGDGIPAGSTLNSYSYDVTVASADWLSEISLSGTYPGGALFTLGTGTFGGNAPGTNNQTGSPGVSGTALGTYTFVWDDAIDFGETAPGCATEHDNIIQAASFTIDYTPPANVTWTIVKSDPPTITTDGGAIGVVNVGDVLTYTVIATNTGTDTANAVVVTDPLLTGSPENCASVAPSATCVLVGTYTVQAGDGTITNTANVVSTETPTAQDSNPVNTPIAEISVVKSDPPALTNDADGSGTISEGDTLTYTSTVTNEGDITLNNVTVNDPLPGFVVSNDTCAGGSLASAATCQLIGTYVVTAADGIAGTISNTVTANSTETAATNDSVVTTVVTPPAAALTVTKVLTSSADEDGSATVTLNDTLTYTITVENTGGQNANNVVASDPLIPTPSINTCNGVILAAAATCQLVGTYQVLAADVTATQISNTATATSDNAATDDDTLVTPVVTPAVLTVSKILSNNADEDASASVTPGDTLEYTITVTNTGGSPATDVVASDPLIPAPTSNTCNTVVLAAGGGNCQLIGDYVVTAADATAGSISNTGSANSTHPGGPETDNLVTPVAASSGSLSLVKAAPTLQNDADGSSSITPGDTLEYVITATNTGPITLNNVTVSDPLLTPTQNICASVVTPAGTCVLTGTYVVQLADVGTLSNTASVQSLQTASQNSNQVDTTVEAQPAALTLDKTVPANADEDGSGTVSVGDTLTYTITATNTGGSNATVVVVSDPLITPNQIVCPVVAPAATCVLVGTYVVTLGNLSIGSISNTADVDSVETSTVMDTEVTEVFPAAGLEPTDVYYMPFPEDQVLTALSTIVPGGTTPPPDSETCGSTTVPAAPLRLYSSIVVLRNKTLIYFDHQEDDFEIDISSPLQSTTEIWGDGNLTNGVAPGVPTDLLDAGTIIQLDEPTIDPTTLDAVFDFDGGDKFAATNIISMTKANWADLTNTLLAGALEMYPTSQWGTSYEFPIGEDTFTGVTNEPFQYVGAAIMAQVDGTILNIDTDGDGTVDIVNQSIDEGESFYVNGGMNIGGTITSSQPVQVAMITGDICDNFESRFYTLFPTADWASSYYNPVSSPVADSTRVRFYNPNPASINILAREGDGTNAIYTVLSGDDGEHIQADGFGAQYCITTGTDPLTATCASTSSTFYAIASVDTDTPNNNGNGGIGDGDTFDWGITLVPQSSLTQQALVGLGFGHDPLLVSTENSSPVWVTADLLGGLTPVDGMITLCVDYENDGVDDLTFDVAPLASTQLRDPNDGDQTGMYIRVCDADAADQNAGVIAVAWGLDPTGASTGSPAIDVGTGIPNIAAIELKKISEVTQDANGDGLPNIGETLLYSIDVTNTGFVPLNPWTVVDNLDTSFLAYVENTTTVNPNDGSGAVAVADNGGGNTPFPLDDAGGEVPTPITAFILASGSTATIQYQVTVIDTPAAPDEICNTGSITVGTDTSSDEDCQVPSSNNSGAIGDRIWLDEDGDGEQDAGEDGIPNIVVELLADTNDDNIPDTVVATTTTDANGEYLFDNLVGGPYTVRVVDESIPPGLNNQTGDPDSTLDDETTVTLNSGEQIDTADFGYNYASSGDTDSPLSGALGAIGDRIWNDANGDGAQDPGELGIEGVTVQLEATLQILAAGIDTNGDGVVDTNDDGSFFDDGGSIVTVVDGLITSGNGVTINGITVVSGQLDLDGDGGIDADDVGSNAFPAGTTTTDATGNYIFDGQPAGVYTVTVTDDNSVLTGFTQTGDPDHFGTTGVNDGTTTTPIVLGPGDVFVNADFGYRNTALPDVSGTVYFDADADGANDIGSGDTAIPSVSVNLVETTVVTNGDVSSSLDTLDGYDVSINGRLDINGDGLVTAADDGYIGPYEVINGRIDVNGDGLITGADDGTLPLVIATTDTDSNGDYLFQDVPPGTYDVVVTDVAFNLVNLEQSGDVDEAGVCTVCDDQTSITVAALDIVDLDFGYLPAGHLAVDGLIGDTVYLDTNADGDQDAGEPGIQGVTVQLYADSNGNGVVDGGEQLIQSAITNDNGTYYFGGLDASDEDYIVIVDTTTLPGNGNGMTNTDDPDLGGAPDVGDSKSAVTLTPGSPNNLDQDFGYADTTPNTIGGTVWEDRNADGTLTDGTGGTDNETANGFAGVTVDLYEGATIVDGRLFTDTDNDGLMDDVFSGIFNRFNVINGFIDFDGSGSVDTNDDGWFKGYQIIDGQVDADGDGTVSDTDDDGILLGSKVGSTTTDSSGDYSFTGLPDGNYVVDVTDDNNVLGGYWKSEGSNTGQDNNSQGDPYPVQVSGGETDTTGDFGYYVDPGSIGNVVWEDTNNDGIRDVGENGISGTTVTLTITYPNGDTLIVTTTTDGSGNYSFDNLLLDEDYNGISGSPTYTISVDGPFEWTSTYDGSPDTTGIGNGTDDNADNNSGEQASPPQGGVDNTNDFGFIPLDYGDAPAANYGVSTHTVNNELFIGSVPDPDSANQPNANATGDDSDTQGDDEDGVNFRSPPNGFHSEIFADVDVVNNTGDDAFLCAWLDRWDSVGTAGGSFTASDTPDGLLGPCATIPDDGTNTNTFTFFWGPLEDAIGFTYARFRLCTTLSECNSPAGVASDGEVEDYRINFNFTTAVIIGDVELSSIAVSDFLAQIGVGDMSRSELLSLLEVWDPQAAAALVDADAASIVDALIAFLDPDGDGQVALFQWETLEEMGTIGFYAERQNEDGSWARINNKLLPGLVSAPLGGDYMLADPYALSGNTYSYRLIEVEATGQTKTYGSFELEMP